MIASVAATAPLTPPETGASMKGVPRAASRAPRSRVPTGDDELMSMTSVSFAARSRMQFLKLSFAPHSAVRTDLPSGSMVMMIFAAAPSSERLFATVTAPCSRFNAVVREASRSNTTSV
jgi:hypothetical protein